MKELSKRSSEYDLVRIILMLMLPLIHVVQYWGYICDGADLIVHSDVDKIYPVVQFALYFTAPCFMIMMGINMLFTRHSTPKHFLCRGILLLCIEFLFNIVRYILPACIGFVIGEYRQEVMDYAVFGLFNSDILAFAGLAFIVMAWFKKLHLSSHGIILASFIMWLVGIMTTHFVAPWLNDHCGNETLNILGSFIWVNADSNFSLLLWIVFPAVGYLFIDELSKADIKEKAERIWLCSTLGGLLVMIMEIGIVKYMELPVYETLSVNGAHHFLTPQVVIFSTSATFVLMGLCHFAAPFLLHSPRLKQIVNVLGSKITIFYIIQWTLVGWGLFLTGGTDLWGCQQLTLRPTVFAITAITLISVLASLPKISRRWLR